MLHVVDMVVWTRKRGPPRHTVQVLMGGGWCPEAWPVTRLGLGWGFCCQDRVPDS